MIALLAGCYNSGPPLPKPVPAKGTLTLPGGQRLKAGRVMLNPKDQGGVEAFGDLKPDGTFILSTYKPEDGAVPGAYVVSVSPYDYRDKSGSPKKVSGANQIPARYLEANSSDLEVEIKATGDNVLDVRLKR
jgi:hypothetical protein